MKDLHLTIPTTWPDVGRQKLADISGLFFQGLTPRQFKTKALLILSDLKRVRDGEVYFDPGESCYRYEFWHKEHGKLFISQQQLYDLSEYCSFLLEEIHDIDPPSIWWQRGPDKRLFKSIFDQYLNAENEFEAYRSMGNEQHLERLMAIFYRYPWQRFNDSKLRKRSRKFRRFPVAKKYIIFMWYAGVRGYISSRFPHLFKVEGDDGGDMDMFEQVSNMIRALNKGDVTKNDQLLKSNTYDALAELDHMSKEAEEMKSKTKK